MSDNKPFSKEEIEFYDQLMAKEMYNYDESLGYKIEILTKIALAAKKLSKNMSFYKDMHYQNEQGDWVLNQYKIDHNNNLDELFTALREAENLNII